MGVCNRFKTIYSYTLFGATLGAAIGAVWTLLFMAMDARFDRFFILFGTAVGAITLLLMVKYIKVVDEKSFYFIFNIY